jgi:hypothetical protein
VSDRMDAAHRNDVNPDKHGWGNPRALSLNHSSAGSIGAAATKILGGSGHGMWDRRSSRDAESANSRWVDTSLLKRVSRR